VSPGLIGGVLRRAAVVIAVTAFALAACGGRNPGRPPDMGRSQLVIRTADHPVRLHVEVADTPPERETGLMGRTSLGADDGMAFLWRSPVREVFWMKDTPIPLSIAFWDARDRIVAILDLPPCQADPCPTYDPQVPFIGAVEANQGFFSERGVRLGDRVRVIQPTSP
jgi:uncharacterized membrane protein (UPF0127 family)